MAKVQRHGHGQETGDVMMATGLQLPLSQGDFRGCPVAITKLAKPTGFRFVPLKSMEIHEKSHENTVECSALGGSNVFTAAPRDHSNELSQQLLFQSLQRHREVNHLVRQLTAPANMAICQSSKLGNPY